MPCCSAARMKAKKIATAKAIKVAKKKHPPGVKAKVPPAKKAKGKKAHAPKRAPCKICAKKATLGKAKKK